MNVTKIDNAQVKIISQKSILEGEHTLPQARVTTNLEKGRIEIAQAVVKPRHRNRYHRLYKGRFMCVSESKKNDHSVHIHGWLKNIPTDIEELERYMRAFINELAQCGQLIIDTQV